MGLAKSEWMESEERGWTAPEKSVCADCIEDDYLKSVILDCAENKKCDYCQRKSPRPISAPLSYVVEPIAYALFSYFADPTEAGLPRDSGEWVGENLITYTEDALLF